MLLHNTNAIALIKTVSILFIIYEDKKTAKNAVLNFPVNSLPLASANGISQAIKMALAKYVRNVWLKPDLVSCKPLAKANGNEKQF